MATQSPASFERRHSGAEKLATNTSPDKCPPVDCTDSGYSSSRSTPDGKSSEVAKFELRHTVSRQLFSRFKKTKLRPFDQEISQAVQNRFSDLTELFSPSLYSFLVLGKDERSAKPWVVVQCDEAASKPIKNFFDQSEVKSQYRPGDSESDLPSFDVVIHPRAPVSLATSHLASVYCNSWADVETLCGRIIKIGSPDKPHIATLGGVIMVEFPSRGKFMLRGLTAGHILTQEPATGHDNGRESPSTYIYTAHSSCQNASAHLKPEVQKVEDGLVHDLGHPQEQEDGESTASFELCEEEFEIDLAVEIDTAAKGPISFRDSSLDNITQDSQEQSWSKIGSIYSTSRDVHARPESDQQSGPDHDWALVEIDPLVYRPNLLADQPSGANIVELTAISGILDESGGSRAVVLASGKGGLKRGSLSLSPSFLMLGQAKSFTKTYNLRLHHVPAPNTGDSGSWVVGEQSHGVYGHLVASDALGEAYFVPFDKILLDIKHSLGAVSICLPSRSDFHNWRNGHYVNVMDSGRPGLQNDPKPSPDSGYASSAGTPVRANERALPPPYVPERASLRPSNVSSRELLPEFPRFSQFEQTVQERKSQLIEPEQPAVPEKPPNTPMALPRTNTPSRHHPSQAIEVEPRQERTSRLIEPEQPAVPKSQNRDKPKGFLNFINRLFRGSARTSSKKDYETESRRSRLPSTRRRLRLNSKQVEDRHPIPVHPPSQTPTPPFYRPSPVSLHYNAPLVPNQQNQN